MGEFFFAKPDGRMHPQIHTFCEPTLPAEVDKWLSRGSFASQPGPLGKLAIELLDQLFEALIEVSAIDEKTTSDEDKIIPILELTMLSVTCKLMLTVGRRHILRLFTSKHATNLGCRLICIGDYAESTPPGMLTATEIEENAAFLAKYDLEVFYQIVNWVYEMAWKVSNDTTWMRLSRRLRDKHSDAPSNPQHALELKMIKTFIKAFDKPSYPHGPKVLCNLSKGEYVREEPLLAINKVVPVTLLHAVLSRICWSDDPSMSLVCSQDYEDKFVKGPWAGDRFQIFGADQMPAPKAGTVWKDVTNEVYEFLRHLWVLNIDGDEDDFVWAFNDGDKFEDDNDVYMSIRRMS